MTDRIIFKTDSMTVEMPTENLNRIFTIAHVIENRCCVTEATEYHGSECDCNPDSIMSLETAKTFADPILLMAVLNVP